MLPAQLSWDPSTSSVIVHPEGKSIGKLIQLPGCCGLWLFHSFTGLFFDREKDIVPWIESFLYTQRHWSFLRGGLQLTVDTSFVDFIEELNASKEPWTRTSFFNPQTTHKVWIYFLPQKKDQR